jgi:hypothetical protein
MKTERRHELQTNVLANMLGHQVEAVRPYLKHLGIAALIAAVAVASYTYVQKTRNTISYEAWEDYYSALAERDSNRLRTVAENHAGTDAGLWAKESEADLELARGLEALFHDRSEARTALRRAERRFEEISKEAKPNSPLALKAQFGLGQAKEAQDQVAEARKCYEAVVRDASDSPLGKRAQERLTLLGQPAVEKWYDWFSRQKPTPPPKPTDVGAAPAASGDLGKLSDTPDVTLPSAPSAPTEPAKAPAVTEPAASPAAAAPAPPAEAMPAEPAPAPAPPAPAAPSTGDAPKPAEATPAASPAPATEPPPAAPPATAAPEKPPAP